MNRALTQVSAPYHSIATVLVSVYRLLDVCVVEAQHTSINSRS